MSRSLNIAAFLAALVCTANSVTAAEADSADHACAQVLELLAEAEARFVPPNIDQFVTTQVALREETERVAAAMAAQGPEYAAAWKSYLHWDLLEKNLGGPDEVKYDELAVVRRWLYSNRKGIEYPFFAELRTRIDAHLDAAYTFTLPYLEQSYAEHLALVRRQCRDLTENPSVENAAALGRTLGWFEQTGQLADEVAVARRLLSHPNLQLVISPSLISRVFDFRATEVEQSMRVVEHTTTPPSGMFGTVRPLFITGAAHTKGRFTLELAPNSEVAEASLIFDGKVFAHCYADAGPVVLEVQTGGPVVATKPLYFGPAGLDLGVAQVEPQVRTRLVGVTSDSNLMRRIGQRRANEPSAQASMRSSARSRVISQLREEMDSQIQGVLDQLRAELAANREHLNGFSEVLAPIAREGATPRFEGTRSGTQGIEFNVYAERREQFAAPTFCPINPFDADLMLRVHVSFANNMLETFLGGKTLSDEFLMRYAKILQPVVPLPLMVHARSERWGVVTCKEQPIVVLNPAENVFELVFRLEGMVREGVEYPGPTRMAVAYSLEQNDFGEYGLVRQGEVQVDSNLSDENREFLQTKLDAFFAEQLDGGGVSVPDSGRLGALANLQSKGVVAKHDWIVLGVDVPDEVLEEILPEALRGAAR